MAHSSFLTVHNGKLILILILSKESMKRVENHDPMIHEGKVIANQVHHQFPKLTQEQCEAYPIGMLDIMICHEEEAEIVAKAREIGDGKSLMKWLARNWSDEDRPVTKEGYTYVESIPAKRTGEDETPPVAFRLGLLGRWIIVNAKDENFAWSGSRWVPHADGVATGDAQVCNFATHLEAEEYARGRSFE